MTLLMAGLGIFVMVFVSLKYPRRIGKGKFISMPMRKIRFFNSPSIRVKQYFFVFLIIMPFEMIISNRAAGKLSVVFWTIIIALYMDDYLTGDDDKWKKFRDSVRNKIKWKMKLPAPKTHSNTV